MGVGLAIILFLALTLGWMLLPFLPGLREIVRKDDAEALPISRRSEVDVRHFAQGFRTYLDRTLAGMLDRSRREGEILTGELADGTPYLVVPDGETAVDIGDDERAYCRTLIVSPGDLSLPDDCVHAAEIYAAGDLTGGARSVYRAAMAEGALELAAGSASLRWLHAGRSLRVNDNCRLWGRVSSEGPLHLAAGCRFERLHAQVIDFGDPAEASEVALARADAPVVEAGDIAHLVDTRGGRWLVAGDFELAAGRRLEHDLVVNGAVILREGSSLKGSLKSRGPLRTERGVRIDGAVVGEQDVALGRDGVIGGPVISERTLTLGTRCVVGAPDVPTTVSARDIRVEPGSRCHGTVWAHQRGDVLVPVGRISGKDGTA